jgi:hypothetical protein
MCATILRPGPRHLSDCRLMHQLRIQMVLAPSLLSLLLLAPRASTSLSFVPGWPPFSPVAPQVFGPTDSSALCHRSNHTHCVEIRIKLCCRYNAHTTFVAFPAPSRAARDVYIILVIVVGCCSIFGNALFAIFSLRCARLFSIELLLLRRALLEFGAFAMACVSVRFNGLRCKTLPGHSKSRFLIAQLLRLPMRSQFLLAAVLGAFSTSFRID